MGSLSPYSPSPFPKPIPASRCHATRHPQDSASSSAHPALNGAAAGTGTDEEAPSGPAAHDALSTALAPAPEGERPSVQRTSRRTPGAVSGGGKGSDAPFDSASSHAPPLSKAKSSGMLDTATADRFAKFKKALQGDAVNAVEVRNQHSVTALGLTARARPHQHFAVIVRGR